MDYNDNPPYESEMVAADSGKYGHYANSDDESTDNFLTRVSQSVINTAKETSQSIVNGAKGVSQSIANGAKGTSQSIANGAKDIVNKFRPNNNVVTEPNNITVPNNLVLNGRYTFDFNSYTSIKSVNATVLKINITLKDEAGEINTYPINLIKNATPIAIVGGRKKTSLKHRKSKKSRKSRRR